jgi:hypothetical protein
MDPDTVEQIIIRTPTRDVAGRVAALRRQRDILESEKRLLSAEIQNSPLYKDLERTKEKLVGLGAELETAEAELRTGLLDLYEQTEKKHLPYGEIKLFVTLKYNERDAVAWAIRGDMLSLLNLDTKGFEKIAKAADLDFVEKRSDPRAFLHSDLSEFLPKE